MKLSVIVTLVALVLSMTAPSARAADNAVIIEGWLPPEAVGLDWVPADKDTLDEWWNDSYLAFEMFCARPGIDSSPDRIHMLWGTTGEGHFPYF